MRAIWCEGSDVIASEMNIMDEHMLSAPNAGCVRATKFFPLPLSKARLNSPMKPSLNISWYQKKKVVEANMSARSAAIKYSKLCPFGSASFFHNVHTRWITATLPG